MNWKTLIPLLVALALAGCGITPVHTLDEKMNHPLAHRPLVEGEIPYHVNLVYANAAWQQLDQAEVPGVPGIDTQSTLELPRSRSPTISPMVPAPP